MAQALRPSDDPNYKQSRSALREIYGSRRINGKAGISAADTTPSAVEARRSGITDTTPSGRARQLREQAAEAGIAEPSPKQLRKEDQTLWEATFGPDRERMQRPMSRMASATAGPAPALDIYGELMGQPGVVDNPLGSQQRFNLSPTTPPDMRAVAAQLNDIPMPRSMFSNANIPRPSVLRGASKWLQKV